jgi:hypothetical protein
MLAGFMTAAPAGMYLPPAETGGSDYQFNPASPELRKAFKTEVRSKDDLFDVRDMAEDLVFLRRALRKQYPGYAELLQRPDFDVEALFDEHIARLRAGPPKVKYADSALALFLELKKQIEDRHLSLLGPGWERAPTDDYSEYQAAIDAPVASLEKCTTSRAAPTTLRVAPLLASNGKGGQVVTVSARAQGETIDLTCDDRRITLTRRPPVAREDGFSKKPAYEWKRVGGAAIIRIRRFDGRPADLERLEQMVKDYPEHRRSPLVVIDMRGNGGGNDSYAYRWVEQAARGQWEIDAWSVYPVGSFLPWVLWNHEVWIAIRQDRVDDPTAVAKRNAHRDKWPRSAAELSIQFKPERQRGVAKTPYKGRVFVLVDRQCGSSGESAAQAFQGGVRATLLGERTAGVAEYGNVRTLALPRTHLIFAFATKRNYFLTPIEGLGIPVDVYLSPELYGEACRGVAPAAEEAAAIASLCRKCR